MTGRDSEGHEVLATCSTKAKHMCSDKKGKFKKSYYFDIVIETFLLKVHFKRYNILSKIIGKKKIIWIW